MSVSQGVDYCHLCFADAPDRFPGGRQAAPARRWCSARTAKRLDPTRTIAITMVHLNATEAAALGIDRATLLEQLQYLETH